MSRFEFAVEKHKEYGELGLRPKWYPEGDPLGGMAAAHDILEHWRNDDGSAEGEFMALGAGMWIRGKGGYQNDRTGRSFDPVLDPAADISDIWDRLRYHAGRNYVVPCGLVRDSSALDTARACVAEGMKEIRHRLDRDEWPSEKTQEHIARWLARGYVRAQRRYRNVVGGVCALAWLFMQIEREADKHLKHADEGMILTVRVNVTRSRYSLSCDYPTDY